MGHDPHGRRHSSPRGWTSPTATAPAGADANSSCRSPRPSAPAGCPRSSRPSTPSTSASSAGMPLPPVMIYGDDVSHVVTEEGVAYLYKAHSLADRRAALAAVAGVTPVGPRRRPRHRGTTPRWPGCLPRGPRRRDATGQPLTAGRAQHRGPGRLVRRPLRPAGTVPGLVSMPSITRFVAATATAVADVAVSALCAEADLTPKPGLVDRRGAGAHTDMNRDDAARLRRVAAHRLRECASAATEIPLIGLRARIGRSAAPANGPCSPPPAASTPTAARCGRWACSAPGRSDWRAVELTDYAATLARLADPAAHGVEQPLVARC